MPSALRLSRARTFCSTIWWCTASECGSNVNRAAFLDRDGVINAAVATPLGPDSPRSVAEFKLLPGVAGAIKTLNGLGLPVVVVSNQPRIAKGKFAAESLQAMTDRMNATLERNGASLDGIYYCLHHPDAVVRTYRMICDCRKPKPGLLTKAAEQMDLALAGSYMVGDQVRDMVAGK